MKPVIRIQIMKKVATVSVRATYLGRKHGFVFSPRYA